MSVKLLLMETIMAWFEFSQIIFVIAFLFLIVSYACKYFLMQPFFVYGVGNDDKDPSKDPILPHDQSKNQSFPENLNPSDLNESITLTKAQLQQLISEQVQKALANVTNSPIPSTSGLQMSAQSSDPVIPQVGGTASAINSSHAFQNSSSLAHVAFKPPQPLHLQNPNVWFAILEQQFRLAGITQEATKFSHAVSSLDARLHNSFADLIIRDKGNTPYATFKEEVIKSLGESEKTKLHNLLHGLTLGDQKPSQLLSKFKANAGNNFAADSIKQLWMARLPPQVQIVLTPFENDVSLSVLAKRADDVMETMSQVDSVNHVVASTSYSQFSSQMNKTESDLNTRLTSMKTEILSEISALLDKRSESQNKYSNQDSSPGQSSSRNRSSSHNRSFRRNRSPSKDNNKNSDVCFYHRKFNDKAQKCVSSCKHHKAFVANCDNSKN